eukprot:CAMPEP_0201681380 /NCGR_PEP_ID=MMETSP0494-20130426/51078_1 /ASSEMBLY_ACC=CAM_ASM_000839 /TAXON_ID=420259 /ORGANISM="Thalassiosira gravida, Strain GMp14c1" /LENGTH=503 /DNA_ID=CAMNT_0048165121 /DNA_START=376 /DNA_END=1889 /DNA_ORIENTATION=-
MNIMSDVMEPFVYKLGVEVPHDVIFVVVHHSVKILPNSALRGFRQLKKVTLPEGLEEIGDETFYDCVSLEQINYPSSLIRIGEGAFAECHSLKDVTLPEGLEEIGEGAFATCESLKCINCPSAVIKIGMYAFAMCTSLTNVTLAGGVVTIERDTFSDCPSLEGITIPPKAFVIEVEVDSDGDSDGDYDSDSEGDGHIFTCELVLTDNGTIPLTDAKQMIVSPEHLNYISSCDLLEIENAITIPPLSSRLVVMHLGVPFIDESDALGRINYPSSLIKIGGHAFAGCHSLTKVTRSDASIIPPLSSRLVVMHLGVPFIDESDALGRINYPSSLIKIGGHAFAGCHSLTKVTLAGGGVVTIEGDAFGSCPSLDGVTIPPKAFIIEVGHVFTCQLVLTDNGTIPLSDAKQMIVSPEHLNYISSCDLLEIENAITTILNDQGRTREENIEQVLALIKSRALFEVSTILELALWKINIDKIDDSTPGTRAECRVTCGSDYIIPGVKSYL